MSTAEQNPVRTFDLTVVCAQGTFNPLLPTYVIVDVGGQCYRTKDTQDINKPVWNATWKFTITTCVRDTTIKIQLYIVSPTTENILLGEIEEQLFACEPRNTDIVKSLERSGEICKFNITFRIGDTKFSGYHSGIQALVIGVNKYPRISQLNGCVNDALAMKALLSDRFHVPDDQIKLLLDKSATRDAILSYLQEGFTRADCDTVVIYFAGHGSRIDTPPNWPYGDRKIETICPYDTGLADDKTGKPICGVEDYRFNVLLHKLAAEKKSNNITVILDSCHSAGAARDDDDANGEVRSVETTVPVPSDWKEVLAATDDRGGEQAIPTGFRYEDLESHVLLAACGQYERAREVEDSESKLRRGRFTMELVKYLYENPIDIVTNQQLIELLPKWPTQHPQYVGHHSRCTIFDRKIVITDMSSGALNVPNNFLQVGNDAFMLKVFLSSDSDPGLSRGLRDDSPASPVASRSTSALASDTLRPARKFILADSQQTADIKLTITRSHSNSHVEVGINRLDPLTSGTDPSQTEFKLDISKLQYLPHILNRVSQFHFYLRAHNTYAPLKYKIDVEFFELDRTKDTPLPTNLFTTHALPQSEPETDGHAHMIEDRKKRYGFLISNRSKSDIFPYLFYFDPRSYQIQVWHAPIGPILAQRGSAPTKMPVGFGDGGGFPFSFSVPDIQGISSDTGFLKLFVSTERIPFLADIEQLDPLKPQASDRIGYQDASTNGLWDVWIGTITVERRGK